MTWRLKLAGALAMTTVLWAGFYAGDSHAAREAADPGVQQTATQVREWMSRQGFRVPDRPVWVTDRITSPWVSDVLILGVATSDGPLIIRDVTRGPDSRLATMGVLIHEYLHLLRDPDEYSALSPAERMVEEGAVTAVTEDLSPRFECAVWKSCGPAGWMVFQEGSDRESRWAAMVRGVSQRATRRPVNSPQARAWRYQLVKADRATRAVMWNQATGVTR